MTQLAKVMFSGLIWKLSIKSLVCGDKEAELTIRFRPDDDTLDKLNRLHRADSEAVIIVAES